MTEDHRATRSAAGGVTPLACCKVGGTVHPSPCPRHGAVRDFAREVLRRDPAEQHLRAWQHTERVTLHHDAAGGLRVSDGPRDVVLYVPGDVLAGWQLAAPSSYEAAAAVTVRLSAGLRVARAHPERVRTPCER